MFIRFPNAFAMICVIRLAGVRLMCGSTQASLGSIFLDRHKHFLLLRVPLVLHPFQNLCYYHWVYEPFKSALLGIFRL